jgi:hypothetical protein
MTRLLAIALLVLLVAALASSAFAGFGEIPAPNCRTFEHSGPTMQKIVTYAPPPGRPMIEGPAFLVCRHWIEVVNYDDPPWFCREAAPASNTHGHPLLKVERASHAKRGSQYKCVYRLIRQYIDYSLTQTPAPQ